MVRRNMFHYVVVPDGKIEVRDSNNAVWITYQGPGSIVRAREFVKEKNKV